MNENIHPSTLYHLIVSIVSLSLYSPMKQRGARTSPGCYLAAAGRSPGTHILNIVLLCFLGFSPKPRSALAKRPVHCQRSNDPATAHFITAPFITSSLQLLLPFSSMLLRLQWPQCKMAVGIKSKAWNCCFQNFYR